MMSTIVWRGIAIAILLVVVWVVAKLVVGIAGALIHLLLLIAFLVLVYVVVRYALARRS